MENTITMQALVAGARLLRPQLLFKIIISSGWTDVALSSTYLIFAEITLPAVRRTLQVDEVEKLLDSCRALMNYGVDRFSRPQKISLQEEARQKAGRYLAR